MDNKENNNTENIESEQNAALSEIIEDDIVVEKTQTMIEAQYFAAEGGETKPKKKRFIERYAEEVFEWVEIFASALLTVILLFTFIFRMVTVEGSSMQETLHEKDNLIISHLFYTPKQNDIVVIQVPNSSFPVPIIKRVIATEGQTVDFDFDNWLVYVDGEPLDEPYVNYIAGESMRSDSILLDALPITVEPGKIFVMGDNRNNSADSRNALIGQVDINNVVGRVMVRIFPFDKFGKVKAHEE